MSKSVKHDREATAAILRGVDFLADVVKITEGPRGRNIILGQRMLGQSPKVTRDGVTVANYTDPVDPTEQMGADLIREAAQKTDNAVGDGTTASIVLAQALIHAGFVEINEHKANPLGLERGLRKSVDLLVDKLQRMAVKATPEKVFQVATVSAHGDEEIGRLVADAIAKAGPDGVVTAEPSSTSETYVEQVAGMELEKSNLLSPVFITHPEEMKSELHNCRILLWEGVIATAKSLVPILQQVRTDGIPLLIVAGGYEAEALSVIIQNKMKLALPINAIRMEHYGERRKEVMRDIAALTGGKAFTDDMGEKIENVVVKNLGSARKVITTMSKTQLIEGRGKQEELAGRVAHIRTAMETAEPAAKSVLRVRLAALLGGITVIKVGGITVTEMEEKKDRVVDAMSAAKAAVDSGIVEGGGMALFHARVSLDGEFEAGVPKDEHSGINVARVACHAVLKQIVSNVNGDEFSERVMKYISDNQWIGYNAMTCVYENLLDAGIIDPVKVVITSLKNAAAVASSILTMGATVSEIMERTNVSA